jgi:hypothetical protein
MNPLTYGKHAISKHDYTPTAADPFAAEHIPSYPWRDLRDMVREGTRPVTYFNVIDYMVYRAATRSTLGMTGRHRAGSYYYIPAAGFARHAA